MQSAITAGEPPWLLTIYIISIVSHCFDPVPVTTAPVVRAALAGKDMVVSLLLVELKDVPVTFLHHLEDVSKVETLALKLVYYTPMI